MVKKKGRFGLAVILSTALVLAMGPAPSLDLFATGKSDLSWAMEGTVEEKEAPPEAGVTMFVNETTYWVDGDEREMDFAPFIEDGRTFVPVRFAAREFGLEADWGPKDTLTEWVRLFDEDIDILITIGEKEITVIEAVNIEGDAERTVESDVPAQIVNGRTVLPLRAVGEILGADFDWGPKEELTEWVNFSYEEEKEELIGKKIEYDNEVEGLEGTVIKVLDENDNVIFEYTHEEFIAWAEDNWEDIFEETPAFHEERPIYPENLSYFEDTATLDPSGKKFAFSVHDYFAAAQMSFVGVVNLETGETELVNEENRGGIEEFSWSPEGNYLTYALNTAKAARLYLTNDNINAMSKEFTIGEEELREVLNEDEYPTFLPFFRELEWKEDESRLEFITNAPEDKEAEEIKWSIHPAGDDLIKEDVFGPGP